MVGVEVGQEQRQPGQALAAGAGQQQHDLALQRLAWSRSCGRGPRSRPRPSGSARVVMRDGVGAGVGLGHPEGHVQVAGGRPGQERLLQPLAAEPHHRVEPEDRQVQRRAAVHGRAAAGHLPQHDRRLGDAPPAAAVLLGDGDAQPAALGHPPVEVPGEARARRRSAPSSRRRSRRTPGATASAMASWSSSGVKSTGLSPRPWPPAPRRAAGWRT